MGIQIRGLGELRRRLLDLHHPDRAELAEFLSDRVMTKGSLYTLRRKCSKPTCRCVAGARHETMVLTASIGGKKHLQQIAADQLEEVRQRTEIYRRFRKARSRFLKEKGKRHREMLRVIDEIAKARVRQPRE